MLLSSDKTQSQVEARLCMGRNSVCTSVCVRVRVWDYGDIVLQERPLFDGGIINTSLSWQTCALVMRRAWGERPCDSTGVAFSLGGSGFTSR